MIEYYINGDRLGNVVQSDLGVRVHQTLKTSVQVQQAVRKTNGMLSFIARGFEYSSMDVFLQIYRASERPHQGEIAATGPVFTGI